MAATRRLGKELNDLRAAKGKEFRQIIVDEANILNWTGLICSDEPPYKDGAFKIEIAFPAEYPFKPPKITFKTKIYHPNIDEKGQVCLPIISPENIETEFSRFSSEITCTQKHKWKCMYRPLSLGIYYCINIFSI